MKHHLQNFFRVLLTGTMLALLWPVQARAVTIVLTYDGSISTLANSAQIEGAINYAALQLQGLLTDPVTVNIYVTASAGTGTNVGGVYVPNAPGVYSYYQIRTALANHASSPYQTMGLSTLPTNSDPFRGAGFVVARAQAKLLGLMGPSTQSDGTFTLQLGYTYATDPNNRAVSNQYDLVGIAEHYLTHILGRVSGVASTYYQPLDVYRYNGVNSRAFTYYYSDYLSLDGGNTILQYYDPPSDIYGDTADWSYVFVGDAFTIPRVTNTIYSITPVDMAEMSALGYAEGTATGAPVITSATTATATTGQIFSYTITGTNSPTSYGVSSGLPTWLTVNQTTGVISGIAPSTGTFPMTITASNALGTASAPLTVTVGVTDAIGGTPVGGGWNYSTWFGYYNSNSYPWIYRADLGFMYLSTTNGTDLYFFVQNGSGGTSMGWIYTTSTQFPNVYSFTRNSWLYFTGNTSFYNYTTMSFETY